jgi:hypothetical protein
MPDLDKLDRIRALEGPKHAVNAIARIAIDPAYAPFVKTADEKIADFLRLPPVGE